MKYTLAIVTILVLAVSVVAQETSELSTPPNGDAERSEVSQWIVPVKISIAYHSPHVHNPRPTIAWPYLGRTRTLRVL